MRKLFFILLCFSSVRILAQQKTDSASIVYDIAGRFLYNTIWTERSSLQQFTKNHPVGVQLDFGITKTSQQAWNYCNCYSRNGVSLSYFNFGNTQLGSAFTFSFFTEPTLVSKNNFSLSARGSAGVALLNKLYDSISNRDNIFFSSHLSYYLMLGINAKVRINKILTLSASGQLNHISNGGKKDPNEGMNFPGVSIGLDFTLTNAELVRRQREKFTDKKIGLMMHLFAAQRTAQATNVYQEEARIVSGLNLGLIKRLGRLNGIGAGGEFYYDGINSVYQSRTGQAIQTAVAGVSIQHYLFLGKLLFGQQCAWFVTPNTGYDKKLYQRYFLEYEIKKNWYAGFTLKAHGDRSDYLAFSVGRQLKF